MADNIIEELQMTEQALQNLVMQKQIFQLELLETNSALEELKNLKTDEVYKVVGSIMIKTNKEAQIKELKKKSDILELRLKSIENQEEELKNKALKVRSEFLKKTKVEKK
jgi:prefoldin beta subunit